MHCVSMVAFAVVLHALDARSGCGACKSRASTTDIEEVAPLTSLQGIQQGMVLAVTRVAGLYRRATTTGGAAPRSPTKSLLGLNVCHVNKFLSQGRPVRQLSCHIKRSSFVSIATNCECAAARKPRPVAGESLRRQRARRRSHGRVPRDQEISLQSSKRPPRDGTFKVTARTPTCVFAWTPRGYENWYLSQATVSSRGAVIPSVVRLWDLQTAFGYKDY
jgi:hypothetical protein